MSKGRSAAKLVPVLVVCLLTQGCFGLVGMRTKTETFSTPWLSQHPSIDGVRKSDWTNGPTALWLEDHWGKPAGVKPASADGPAERWTYKFKLVWYGIIPAFVVPVPVVVPLSREKVVFSIRDGRVVSADVTRSHGTGFAWGPLGPDAYSWSYASW